MVSNLNQCASLDSDLQFQRTKQSLISQTQVSNAREHTIESLKKENKELKKDLLIAQAEKDQLQEQADIRTASFNLSMKGNLRLQALVNSHDVSKELLSSLEAKKDELEQANKDITKKHNQLVLDLQVSRKDVTRLEISCADINENYRNLVEDNSSASNTIKSQSPTYRTIKEQLLKAIVEVRFSLHTIKQGERSTSALATKQTNLFNEATRKYEEQLVLFEETVAEREQLRTLLSQQQPSYDSVLDSLFAMTMTEITTNFALNSLTATNLSIKEELSISRSDVKQILLEAVGPLNQEI